MSLPGALNAQITLSRMAVSWFGFDDICTSARRGSLLCPFSRIPCRAEPRTRRSRVSFVLARCLAGKQDDGRCSPKADSTADEHNCESGQQHHDHGFLQ